jgi:hypothetical protein
MLSENILANGNKSKNSGVRSSDSGQCQDSTGINAMIDRRKVDLTDEINLTYDVSDEALESAAGAVWEKAGALTLSFCSGLDTCPA